MVAGPEAVADLEDRLDDFGPEDRQWPPSTINQTSVLRFLAATGILLYPDNADRRDVSRAIGEFSSDLNGMLSYLHVRLGPHNQ